MNSEELYSLVEIADLLGTPSTTIRYRAKLFGEFLQPLKRPKQFRGVRYPATDLGVFQLVDRLYKEERSTGDIRRALEAARDDLTIDAADIPDQPSPPARLSDGADAVARILREGIAQALAPVTDTNRKIAESLDTLHSLLSDRPQAGGDARIESLEQRLEQMEGGGDEVVRLRQRIRELEEDNRRLRRDLEEARRSLPRRFLHRARSLF